MNPLYESKDVRPFPWKKMVGPLIPAIIIFLIPETSIGHAGWDFLPAVALIYLGMLILAVFIFYPQTHFQVYSDCLIIRFSIAYFFQQRIYNEDIISVRDASDWSLLDRSRWTGWWGIRNRATRLDSSVLAIETVKGNYIISVPFIHKAMAALKGVLRPGKVMYQRREPIAEQSEWSDAEKTSALPKGAWRPGTVKMYPQPGLDASKPVSEHVDSTKIGLIGIVGWMIAVLLFPLFYTSGQFPGTGSWLLLPVLILLIVIFLILTRLALPYFKVRFFRDRIEFFWGLIFPRKFALQLDRIESIRPVTFDPMVDFDHGFGIRNGKGRWDGWTGLIASVTNKGIAIESSEQNVVFTCNAAEEVSKELKTLLGGSVIEFQEPSK